ncbi:MAG: hypothetical protein U0Y10_00800 [Spirosomataceae bacterium]
MKTLVKTLMLAAVVAASTVSAFAEEPTETTAKKKAFSVGMYQSVNTTKMNLIVEKSAADRVFVALKNDKDEVLYSETIAKKDAKYWRKFDLSDLQDGKYRFEISSGRDKVVKEVNLSTEKPVSESERAISIR